MPLSDIEIARQTPLRRITDLARERLGIADEHLVPYGHYKAKLSLDHIATLQDRPDGKLVLVTAISPTPAGEGKTTTTRGPGRRARPHRQEGHDRAARAFAGPGVRHEGRCHRRRPGAGGAHGRHQPALHRRLQRHGAGQQPAGRRHRQPHPPRQCAGHRRAPHHLAPRGGHERPRAARHHRRAWAGRPTATRARTASTSWWPPR